MHVPTQCRRSALLGFTFLLLAAVPGACGGGGTASSSATPGADAATSDAPGARDGAAPKPNDGAANGPAPQTVPVTPSPASTQELARLKTQLAALPKTADQLTQAHAVAFLDRLPYDPARAAHHRAGVVVLRDHHRELPASRRSGLGGHPAKGRTGGRLVDARPGRALRDGPAGVHRS